MVNWSPTEWGAFFGAVALLIGALAAAAVTVINALQGVSNRVDATSTKVDALEIKVDGRLTQLLERTAVASRAEGVDVGRGQMASLPVPQVTAAVDPNLVQEDGTMVIGVPSNPTPPVLLVPVDKEKERPS